MIYSIDRFEGDTAVCENDRRERLELPRNAFPPETREGDCFRLLENGEIQMDPEETRRRREAVKRLHERLFRKKEN